MAVTDFFTPTTLDGPPGTDLVGQTLVMAGCEDDGDGEPVVPTTGQIWPRGNP